MPDLSQLRGLGGGCSGRLLRGRGDWGGFVGSGARVVEVGGVRLGEGASYMGGRVLGPYLGLASG